MALYNYIYEKPACKHFQWWYDWAVRSPLAGVVGKSSKAEAAIRKTSLTHLHHQITNAASESLNANIQWVKIHSSRNPDKQNFIHAIYFHCGGLDLAPSPTK